MFKRQGCALSSGFLAVLGTWGLDVKPSSIMRPVGLSKEGALKTQEAKDEESKTQLDDAKYVTEAVIFREEGVTNVVPDERYKHGVAYLHIYRSIHNENDKYLNALLYGRLNTYSNTD